MLSVILLVLAISIDAFAVCVTYGIKKIRIPFHSALIISLVGTVFLLISSLLARFLSRYISENVCAYVSILLLALIGLVSLFENTIKTYLRFHKGQKNVSFSLSGISFAIDIFLDETKADRDNSKFLSSKEAVILAVALSVDSLATGFSAGLSSDYLLIKLVFCFFSGMLFCLLGQSIGEKLRLSSPFELSWLSGVILIILALLKLFRLC